jgi:membrane-associated phospholipid phosphatase
MTPARRAAWACAGLALAFMIETLLVAFRSARITDLEVAGLFARLWNPVVGVPAQVVAVFGGVELTTLLAIGLFVYLRRIGFLAEAWALLSFPLTAALEAVYKRAMYQPPPTAYAHPDGPSVTQLLHVQNLVGNSFPSGHVVRTVLVYGLLAFIVHRLAPPGRLRSLAVPAAVAIIALMALDRLYLDVHWQSDVIGGLLFGGLALAASIAWIEQPWRPNGGATPPSTCDWS